MQYKPLRKVKLKHTSLTDMQLEKKINTVSWQRENGKMAIVTSMVEGELRFSFRLCLDLQKGRVEF